MNKVDERELQTTAQALVNPSAEVQILGAMLNYNDIIDPLNEIVTEDDFSNPLHGRLFKIASQMAAKGEAVSAITLDPYFSLDSEYKGQGGPQFLVQISASAPGKGGVRQLAEQVAELSKRRRAIEAMILAIGQLKSYGSETSVAEVMASLESQVDDDRQKSGTVDAPIHVFMGQALDEMEQPESLLKCKLVPSFDKAVGAVRGGNLLILAGRPGMGKTAAAMTFARGYAENGEATALFSIEMRGAELGERAIAEASYGTDHPIDYTRISQHWLSGAEKIQAHRIRSDLNDLPLHVIDAPSITLGQMSRQIRKWKRLCKAKGQKPSVVIVDYLQKVDPGVKYDNETDKISKVSEGLKRIAKENDVLMIALAQLSRAVEQRENKRPMLSDLRQSGQIEQDADVIVFLYRDAYYAPPKPAADDVEFPAWDAKYGRSENVIELIAAKVRKGTTGVRYAEFVGKYQAVRG